jgi:hypothetical protein
LEAVFSNNRRMGNANLSKIALVSIIFGTLLVASCMNILSTAQASEDQPPTWVLFPAPAYRTNLGVYSAVAVPVNGTAR